ncbi:MAG TPA: response regulator, partial [Polyangiaceae bacterium LLY-WYZ-15_(1-7)]|nr:response regulator [Polyangiaceae bacterium LLY-WYZ-15_(1-7)]
MTTRVLIVDDEPGMSRTLAIALGEEYEVVTAQGGAEALRRLEAGERFGVILCDLMMPGVSGMDVHGALAQWAPDQAARMVFMTGGAYTEQAADFLDGGHPTLRKPFFIDELRLTLRQQVERRTPPVGGPRRP